LHTITACTTRSLGFYTAATDTRASPRRLFGTPAFSKVADWNVHWISYSEAGAIHRARWMAKCIYSLKVELLHEANKAEHDSREK